MPGLKIAILSILAFLISFNAVLSIEYEEICIDNVTLSRYMNFTSCENDVCTDYNFTQYKTCEFGCDNVTNVCRKAEIYEYADYFTVLLILIITAGLMVLIWGKLR